MFSISSSAGRYALRRRGFKGIEIHDHQIDRSDAVLLRLLLILGVIAAVQQPAVHFRMQRFHAPAQHFRPARELGDVFDGHSCLAQQLRRAAGRQYLDLQRRQPPGKLHDSGLVEYAEQRAFHGHVVPPR